MTWATTLRKNSQTILELFDAHRVPLFRFAFRMTGSVAEAEDIVQECFLGLLHPESRYDPERTPARIYLFGAARNQALKRLRRREDSVADAADRADHHSPETEALRAEVADMVADAVMQLPETQREVLILAHYEGIPLPEIAEVMGLEIGAVRSRLQRARSTLKEKLATYAAGGDRKA